MDELTDADVLDTIKYIVHEGRRANAAAQAPPHTQSVAANAQYEEVDETRGSPGSSSSSSYKYSTTEAQELTTVITEAHYTFSASRGHAAESADATSSLGSASKSRQKQELEYLKAKVRELVVVGDSLWQRVAHQQSIKRQKSLSENAKLKEQLEAQLKFFKSLEKIIRKRPSLVVRIKNGYMDVLLSLYRPH